MTVKELINILTNEVKKEDRANAEIEIWHGEQEYGIESMSGFSISPDIVIQLRKIKSPIMKKASFKKEHESMVKEKVRHVSECSEGEKDE